MNNFRKPYVSCVLAFLMLFMSCQSPSISDDSEVNLQKSQYSVEKLVADNLVSLEVITNLINKNANIDLEFLEKNLATISTESDLRSLLVMSNVVNLDGFIFALSDIKQNMEKFAKNNESFLRMSEESQLDAIVNEIELQLSQKKISFYPKGDCWDDRVRDENECAQNWVISMGVATVSGFVSLGWGTAVGFIAAQAQVTLCLSRAVARFQECRENEGQ